MHNQAPTVFGVFFGCFVLLIALMITALMVWVYCRIFAKAGFCWALGLLMFVPIANIIMLFVLAFSDWPIQRQIRALKDQVPMPTPDKPPTQSGDLLQ